MHYFPKGDDIMPYHKDKQQAFQAAQQGHEEVKDTVNELVLDGADYGHQLSHLKNEVNEAYQQIENALEVSSEHQREQLEKMRADLSNVMQQVNQNQN
jgi:predicted  nucleic acid-binding Zn-ribbon protein